MNIANSLLDLPGEQHFLPYVAQLIMVQHPLSTFLLSPGASLSPTKYQAAAWAQPALVLHGHLGPRHREEPGVQETVPTRWRQAR